MKVRSLFFIILIVVVSFAVGFFIKKYSEKFHDRTGWEKVVMDNVTFQYPTNINTEYIHTVDWPPKFNIYTDKLVCSFAGSETDRAGITEKKTINKNEYCVTKVSEGAAGSTYTQYAYVRQIKEKTVVMTFTMRAPQCDNYDDPKKTDCKNEKINFSIDNLADEIFASVRLR